MSSFILFCQIREYQCAAEGRSSTLRTSSVLGLVMHSRTPYGNEHYALKEKKACILGEKASGTDFSGSRLAVRGSQELTCSDCRRPIGECLGPGAFGTKGSLLGWRERLRGYTAENSVFH